RPRGTAREWGAMAACLAGGLLLGLGAMRTQSPLMETTQDGLVARGALARSLETKLAADTPGAVRIGVSFRDQAGDFCRTFTLTHAQTAGLACKSSDGWRVAMTTHAAAQTSEMRMAGAETPPAIVAAIEASIAGEPFDAAAEARARAARWRAVR
ncbi:MAG: anti-sigma factor, partial [Hyphomonadaceae bacterium]